MKKPNLILLAGIFFSLQSFAATVNCHLVKSEDLDKKADKVPANIQITKIGDTSLQYNFIARNKKKIQCKIPKATEAGPLDHAYRGFERYAFKTEGVNQCLDAYVDLKSKTSKKKNWNTVLIGNTDGSATFECK